MTNSQKIVEIGAKAIFSSLEKYLGDVTTGEMQDVAGLFITALKAEGFHIVRLDEEMQRKIAQTLVSDLSKQPASWGVDRAAQAAIETLKGDSMYRPEMVEKILNAASEPPEHSFKSIEEYNEWQNSIASQPAVQLSEDFINVPLLNDAITLITKSLAEMLRGERFASPFAEDHRSTAPKWVIAMFAHDAELRTAYVNDINQYLNWIRNATEKARNQYREQQAIKSRGGVL